MNAQETHFTHDDYAKLEAERDALKAKLEAWDSIMYEIERRADKENCLEDKCDFTVTVMYEDYARTTL